jgi:NosR/NirI family transcriptional regulator, nitrous oxide reductase regulator
MISVWIRKVFILFLMLHSAVLVAADKDHSELYKKLFPAADQFGEFSGEPLSMPVFKAGEQLGYIFRTQDIVSIPAYSGKPVDMLVGMDMKGQFTGAYVIEHHEPIMLVGLPEESLDVFAAQYRNKSVSDRIQVGSGKREGYENIDGITGATVTVMVMNQTISRSSRKFAVSKKIIESVSKQQAVTEVKMDFYRSLGWSEMFGEGSIRNLKLQTADVNKAFIGTEGEAVKYIYCDEEDTDVNCNEFIDLNYAYLNSPSIGKNLLGEDQYNWLMSEIKPGDHAIALMANGLYSFRGNGFVRGGIFDRIQLHQDGKIITFHDKDYYRLSDVYAKDMPEFDEMAIFIVRDSNELNPGQPFQIELMVRRQTGPLKSVFTSFYGDYELPVDYFTQSKPVMTDDEIPLWEMIWQQRSVEAGILIFSLIILTAVLLFQDVVVKFPVFLERFHIGFLIFTIGFIGYYTLAQLSVVNVLTFVHSLMHDFNWQTFLMDPLIFVLWVFVAMSLMLWGRGPFCGWLCPYGAMQELINHVSRHFKVKQWEFPAAVHERLWALKYIILLVLFGISLQSLGEAEKLAEIEPFKTSITLHFAREWSYVFYAVGLLLVSIVNRKFYCKYLCPLGAALAIPGKWHLFDWLLRRTECGQPCQVCANECEIRAIEKNGRINLNECHYCMDCQVTYFNNRKCPPLVKKRKRKEKTDKAVKSYKDEFYRVDVKSIEASKTEA